VAAGDAAVKGTNDFTEQAPLRRWTRDGGWIKVRQWQGPYDNTKIDTLVATLQANGTYDDIELERGWPTIVRASLPDDDSDPNVGTADSIAEWSLDQYDLDKALASHGRFHGSEASAAALATIDAELRQGVAYGVDYEARYGAIGSLNAYVRLRGMGVESYTTDGYILRRTISCSRSSTYLREMQAASTLQGKVVTWEQIGVPASANILQPWVRMYVASIWSGFKYKAGGAGDWADVYFDEWRVKAPSIRFVREGKVKRRQIVQEYVGAVGWSATLYDGGKGVP